MKTNAFVQKLRKPAIILFSALFAAAPVQASIALSEVPLYLTSSVQPNLMFILDDSGSMQWEVMPESLRTEATFYLMPRPSNPYGGSHYDRRIVVFTDTDSLNVRVRSAHNNTVFYNPTVEYEPWYKEDGSQFSDADPTDALHNPALPGKGDVDLTALRSYDRWRSSSGNFTASRNFYPITFYVYKGSGDVSLPSNYTKYQIRGAAGFSQDLNGGAEAGVTTFSWPGGISRTVAEETQNFANWYTYYRSRVLASRAGVGKVFAFQGENLRVGFGTLNKGSSTVDGVSTRSVKRGVRTFNGEDREDFFDELYSHVIGTSGTPMRLALKRTGEYFSRSDNAGPWGNTPGDSSDDTDHVSCRPNYTILMTDGFWNGSSSPAVGNADGSDGETIAGFIGEDSTTYKYEASDPFQDTHENTLADVAMYYWKKDLRTGLKNNVPTTDENPAFWQHMVLFGVGLGVEGNVNPEDAWAAIDGATEIAWGDPHPNTGAEAEKIDDLLHASINARGGFFTASDPEAFTEGLSDTLAAILDRTESSASSVAANSTRLDSDTLIYQARFDSSNWSGQLLAHDVDADGELVDPPVWDAAKLLPVSADRNIYTMNDTSDEGAAFTWSDISATQQAQLNSDGFGTDDGHGQARLDWLRGVRVNEAPDGLGFRDRPAESVLGDIVNSNPWFVGTQNFGFNALPGEEGTRYTTFRNSTEYLERRKMLYVGANDGMLHGFDAQTGVERLAYVPKAIFPYLSRLTSTDYTHRYYVDGTARVSDAYIDPDDTGTSSWHTILVGTTGAGARSIFALDVTDPESFGESDVLWEFTADDNSELGFTLGDATIARLRAGGKWVAIAGNGYNSASDKAQLFIIDLESGDELEVLDTGVGDADNPNGLYAPVPVDVNGDRIADFVYAGDLHGNLWKFDLTGDAVSDWRIAQPDGVSTGPLFTATDASGNVQPIAVRPTVGRHPRGGVMIYFGTGKFFEVNDEIVAADPPIQTFYGIWDKGNEVSSRDVLQEQSIIWQGFQTFEVEGVPKTYELRVPSNLSVDYSTKQGWFFDLFDPNESAGEGERVISRALLRDGRIIFTSMIPEPDPCKFGGDGWIMELDALSGGMLTDVVFDLNGDGKFDGADMVEIDSKDLNPGGLKSDEGIVSTPGVVEDGDKEYKFASGSSGGIDRVVESSGDAPGRKGWWQIR